MKPHRLATIRQMIQAGDLLAEARTIDKVATALGISGKAVEGYVGEWYEELHVDDRDGFIQKWPMYRQGIDEDGRPVRREGSGKLDPAQVRYVQAADGTNIAFAGYGHSQLAPIICLEPPHYSHLQAEWEMDWNQHARKIERLAENRRVIRYDPRGSGLSDRDVEDQSLDARVSDLEAVLARVGVDRLILYAVRNSGLVALEFARRNPDKVVALVLDECFTQGAEFWNDPIQQVLNQLAALDWRTFTELYGRLIYGWDSDVRYDSGYAGVLASETAAYIRTCINSRDFMRWAVAEREIDVSAALNSVISPTLVVTYDPGGRLLPFGPRGSARKLAAAIPNAEMIVVDSLVEILDRMSDFLELA